MINPDDLHTQWVEVGEHDHVSSLVSRLDWLDRNQRRHAVIVVARGDGTFVTFTYADLTRTIIETEGAVLEGSMADALSMIPHVTSPSVDAATADMDEARDLRRFAPARRLVVTSQGSPAGVLIEKRRSDPPLPVAVEEVEGGLFAPAERAARRLAAPPRAARRPPTEGADAVGEAPEPEGQRWLGARVESGQEHRTRSFRSGESNTISVTIGPPDPEWIRGEDPLRHTVPEGEIHALDVLLWAPGLVDTPQRATLELPPTGPAVHPVRFDVIIPEGIERVEFMVEVHHNSRLVQEATLEGTVFDGPDHLTPGEGRISLTLSAGTDLDFDFARPFDALIVTRGEDVLIKVGDEIEQLSLRGVADSMEVISRSLIESARHEARTGVGLSTGSASQLRRIAYHGYLVFTELVKGGGAGLTDARTVEVISRDSGDFFPIELVYDRGTTANDPELCPNWKEAFEGGEPCQNCPAWGSNSGYICPLGFWGLSKEIVRRIVSRLTDDELQHVRTSSPTRERNHLPDITGALVAASRLVDAVCDGGQVDATIEVARSLFADGVVTASTWDEWVAAVETHRPPLLLALPHTHFDESIEVEVLQIGEDSNLDPASVRLEHVQVPVGATGPVLLLLGCGTDAPRTGFLGFVPRFLDNHASVVVGTISKVLGRHAGPVARQFLEEAVAARGSERPVGEVIRRLRGAMLSQGVVMGLSLTVYGDADWRMANGEDLVA
jgi:hypothetical protein